MASDLGTKACPMDYDHESVDYARTWDEQYRALRQQCPIAWSGSHGGYWVASRYKDIVAIAQDGGTFSSMKYQDDAGEVRGGVLIPPGLPARGLPIESDRPEWDSLRTYINRRFAPKAAEERRTKIRDYVTRSIDAIIEKGEADFVYDITGPVPAMTTMDFMGLPMDKWRDYADALHEIVYTAKESPEFPDLMKRFSWVYESCDEAFERYKTLPQQDNLLSYFAHEKLDGRAVTKEEVAGYCLNILAGGVDTTTSLTTNTLAYLCDHPEVKQQLIDKPELLPTAREEFVRYFSPMHGIARNVTRAVTIGDVAMQPGERVFLPWSSANRDPEIFEDPETVKIDRFPNRHIAFGAGTHRCIGSFLARVMFEEMLTQILARMPDYKVHVDRAERYPSIGTINGWINMPVTFTPGRKAA